MINNSDKTAKNSQIILYLRKSSESDERQIQSINDQRNAMIKKAKDLWLIIVKEFSESKSAKAPDMREQFKLLLAYIRESWVRKILCWKLDRLTRNPIDSWTLQYMLQTWEIENIVTSDREYTEYESWLLMSVETWIANQFIIDLKKNVKRWINSKYEEWHRPTRVPAWYLNNKATKKVDIDLKRFRLVRKMWELMLTGNYSMPKIVDIANEKLWYKSRVTKKGWGIIMSKSVLHSIFHNIFYTGYFYYNGELMKWKHKPMISVAEFQIVQDILWNKSTTRPKSYEFPFAWLMKCWSCWNTITVETKRKNNRFKWYTEYTYYHCTWKRVHGTKCKEKSILKQKLEEQIIYILKQIELDKEYAGIIFNVIRKNIESETSLEKSILHVLKANLTKEKNKLENLTDVMLEWLITKEEFINRKEKLELNINQLKEKLVSRDTISLDIDEIEKAFSFSSKAYSVFINGDDNIKREILSSLWVNRKLVWKELSLDINERFINIKNNITDLCTDLAPLEPDKKGYSISNTIALNEDNPVWFGM
jgi:site-specific DNA recombinase